MKRLLIAGLLLMALLAACGSPAPQATGPGRDQVVTVYKSPT
jgi:ABC-type glycerol-3-phosphate transport system substrate-binding protein